MKKVIALLLVLSVTTSIGCTGSFNLTRKVYDTHRSQSDKWADELVFLVVSFLPIYGIATFCDAIVFNSIEFWTGENPVAYNPNGPKKFVSKDGDTLILAYNQDTDQITMTSTMANGTSETIVLERTEAAVIAKDVNGNVLYSSIKNDNGGLTVYNDQIQMVKNISAGQFEDLKQQLLK
ncbi:MAG: DUF3332 domain-containing protein [Candidatus Omnitrophica bacterium]|nr:DUF3332 domain-containing protein [Candidatus Omnitrophota bacterium]